MLPRSPSMPSLTPLSFSALFLRISLTVLLVVAVLAAELMQRHPPTQAAQAAPSQAGLLAVALTATPEHSAKLVDATALRRVAQGDIPMPDGAKAAHASSLLVMPPGDAAALTVFWFSGERESGPLVQIAASQWSRQMQAWTPPRTVANRQVIGDQLGYGLRRFGNPVAWHDAQGRIHLFVVATGWGGWAASRILHLRQSGSGRDIASRTFEPLGVLPLSWLFNTSYLVRNAPLQLADGGMVLPVHFELGLKYPAMLRFDAQGNYQGIVRMSRRTHLLQPTLLATTAQHWVALMRDERVPGKVGAAITLDGGQHWGDLPDTALDNPDASVGGMALRSGQLLLAHNSSVGTRARLDLSVSRDGLNWSLLDTLAQGRPDDEFSYPSMAWVDGSLWISYTVDRQRLAWQRYASAPVLVGATASGAKKGTP